MLTMIRLTITARYGYVGRRTIDVFAALPHCIPIEKNYYAGTITFI